MCVYICVCARACVCVLIHMWKSSNNYWGVGFVYHVSSRY